MPAGTRRSSGTGSPGRRGDEPGRAGPPPCVRSARGRGGGEGGAARGLTTDQVEEFVPILRSRRFLVAGAPGGQSVDEYSPLLAGYPRVPRNAVFRSTGPKSRSTAAARRWSWTRAPPRSSCAATGSARWAGAGRCGASCAAAAPAPGARRRGGIEGPRQGGLPRRRRPQPGRRVDDAVSRARRRPGLRRGRFTTGGQLRSDASEPERHEATLAHLFRAPHPALKGRTFGAALADGLSGGRAPARERTAGACARRRRRPRRARRRAVRALSRSVPVACGDAPLRAGRVARPSWSRTRRPAVWIPEPMETASSIAALCSW